MKNNYIPALDGIRFLAVTMVLIDHWSGDALPFPASYLGVCMFFVLSGFLITRILLNAKQKDEELGRSHRFSLRQFYIRRTIRIFPIYYLTLAALFIMDVSPVRDKIWWLVTYNTNNYIAIYEHWLGIVDHLWSLAVEEQYYIFFPFLVFFLPWRKLPAMLTIALVLSIGFRLFFFLRGDAWMRPYVLTLTCLDAFGLGGLLAYYYRANNRRVIAFFGGWQPLILSLLAYIMIVVWSKSLTPDHNFVTVVLLRFFEALFSLALIGKLAQPAQPDAPSVSLERFFSGKTVVYLGKISYGMYIYHNFVYNPYHSIPNNPFVRLVDYYSKVFSNPLVFQCVKIGTLYVVVVLIATLSWFLIENPINGLKKRFGY